MKKGCCSKCQAKATKKKKPKNIEESSDEEEEVKQTEKEEPKTDSKKEEESRGTSDQKEEKEKKESKILRWQHTSTKKKESPANNKEQGHGNDFFSQPNGFTPPIYRPKSMMYHAGSNPSNWWPVTAVPRGGYPAFTPPPSYGPNGCGGPSHPYQPMARPTMFDACYMLPYPPMAAAFPPSKWYSIPDTNPVTRYTSYLDNYSYSFM